MLRQGGRADRESSLWRLAWMITRFSMGFRRAVRVMNIDNMNMGWWVSPTLRAFGRWRREIVWAAVGCAGTVVLIAGWGWCSYWRMGSVVLTAAGDAVVVQVLENGSDRQVGGPVGLVDRAVITLPAGEYRLRVDGKGRVGRTFRFSVNRGETLAHSISIDDGRSMGGGVEEEPRGFGKQRELNVPIAYAENTHAIELIPGKFDLIECSEKAVVCRDGASGRSAPGTLRIL